MKERRLKASSRCPDHNEYRYTFARSISIRSTGFLLLFNAEIRRRGFSQKTVTEKLMEESRRMPDIVARLRAKSLSLSACSQQCATRLRKRGMIRAVERKSRAIPITGGFSGLERTSGLSQSKAEYVRHSDIYGFRTAMPLCGNGDVLCALNVLGIYHSAETAG